MIRTRDLTVTYETGHGRRRHRVDALAGLDLDVARGEIVGLLGPNGAGKTTALRVLTTLRRPSSGLAEVCGHDVVSDARQVRRRLGYVAQGGSSARGARAGDEVVDRGRLYGLSRSQARSQALDLFERLDLTDLWSRPAGAMSGGQRRRLDIAMALVHAPELVVLDEPTTGLDPQSRANLWEHIRGMRERLGTTVVVTTHYLDEADALSDRLVVVDHGTVVSQGTPEELKVRLRGDVVTVRLADERLALRAAEVVAAATGRLPVRDGVVVTGRLSDEPGQLTSVVRELDRHQVPVESVDLRRPSLDDVFLSLTGRSLRDAA